MTDAHPRYRILAQIASGLAVAASLVFVGIEVRETAIQTELNTEALQLAAYQNLISQVSDITELGLDPDVADLMVLVFGAESGFDDLSPVDNQRITSWFFLVTRYGDLAYRQLEAGVLDEDDVESLVALTLRALRTPMGRTFWASQQEAFPLGYRGYIDRMLDEK